MLSCREDLPLCHGHIFFSPSHNKDGLLSPHWCLNVGVGLGSKCLDLTACQVVGKHKQDKEGEEFNFYCINPIGTTTATLHYNVRYLDIYIDLIKDHSAVFSP